MIGSKRKEKWWNTAICKIHIIIISAEDRVFQPGNKKTGKNEKKKVETLLSQKYFSKKFSCLLGTTKTFHFQKTHNNNNIMSGYTVIYFPARARAELTRLALAAAGQEWTEQVITEETIAEFKASDKCLFGQVPVLLDGEKVIAQSVAMARYVARKHDLLGDLDQSVTGDMILDHWADIFNAVFFFFLLLLLCCNLLFCFYFFFFVLFFFFFFFFSFLN